MMFQKHQFPRTTEWIDFHMDPLLEQGEKFYLQHGTYTTKIIHGTNKYVFTNAAFEKRVFLAANMVKKDCRESGLSGDIINQKHLRQNYSNTDSIYDYIADEVLNIDIKSAYATCLIRSGLISAKTFKFLNSLGKEERLPAVGMLARSYVRYNYEDGKCISVDAFKEPTAEIFYYLIEEIDLIMRDLKWILGSNFIFYWVDGIFFKKDTPKALIQEVETYLVDRGYNYSYEICTSFLYENDNGNCRVLLTKEGELKDYRFCDSQKNNRFIGEHLAKKREQSFIEPF